MIALSPLSLCRKVWHRFLEGYFYMVILLGETMEILLFESMEIQRTGYIGISFTILFGYVRSFAVNLLHIEDILETV